MDHLVVAAKLRILVLDGVEAVRAGGDDRFAIVCAAPLACHRRRCVAVAVRAALCSAAASGLIEAVAVQRFDILLRQHLPEVLVADAPRRIACAGLFGAQDGEIDVGALSTLWRQRRGDLACCARRRSPCSRPSRAHRHPGLRPAWECPDRRPTSARVSLLISQGFRLRSILLKSDVTSWGSRSPPSPDSGAYRRSSAHAR